MRCRGRVGEKILLRAAPADLARERLGGATGFEARRWRSLASIEAAASQRVDGWICLSSLPICLRILRLLGLRIRRLSPTGVHVYYLSQRRVFESPKPKPGSHRHHPLALGRSGPTSEKP